MMQSSYFGVYDQSNGLLRAHRPRVADVHSINQWPSGVVYVHSTDQWKAYMDASKQNNKLLVIEFTATWCGPCRQMEPIIKEFAAKYSDVVFIRIDVDELVSVARQFDVATMPAFALIKKGKEVDKLGGVKKNELQNKIEQHRV